MADRIIKPDSGNDVVIQNNGGTRKLEVTNAGDVEVTGDFKGTTVKATNLKANDGTAGLVIADSTGRVTFSEDNPVITLGTNATFPDSTKNVPAFQAKVSGTLDITKDTNVLAPFDTEIFDTHSAYDNSSGNYKFTVPTGYAGKFAFQVSIEADDDTNTWQRCTLLYALNGGTPTRIEDVNQSHGTNVALSGSFVQNLSVGDDIQIYVKFTLGSSGGNTGNGEILTASLFSGFRLIGV